MTFSTLRKMFLSTAGLTARSCFSSVLISCRLEALLCWALSFLGLVIGKDTLASTTLARFFLQIRFLTSGLL